MLKNNQKLWILALKNYNEYGYYNLGQYHDSKKKGIYNSLDDRINYKIGITKDCRMLNCIASLKMARKNQSVVKYLIKRKTEKIYYKILKKYWKSAYKLFHLKED